MVEALQTLDAGAPSVQQKRHKAQQVAQSRSAIDNWVRYFESMLT